LVQCKSRSIVDQQPDRRPAVGRCEDVFRAFGVGQFGDDLDCAVLNSVGLVMDMSDNRPAIVEQCANDLFSDALAATRDDCCAGFRHAFPLSLRAQRSNPARECGLLRRVAPRNDDAMPERRPPIEAFGQSLAELTEAIAERGGPPPVDRWNPSHCGHSGMRIARDGTWFHEGSPIDRPAMVRLFATVLRREPDGSHVLVTPVEKLTIDVETTAFRATQMTMSGDGDTRRIGVTLDSGDGLVIGPGHPLFVVATELGPSPRIAVRFGLEAELARPLYYELADIALAEGHNPPGVWSDGMFFEMGS
jgi:hypothetical protein